MGFPELRKPVPGPSRLPGHYSMIALLLAGLTLLTLVMLLVAKLAPSGPAAPCNPLRCEGPPVRAHKGAEGSQALPGPTLQGEQEYSSSAGFSLVVQLGYDVEPTVTVSGQVIKLSYPQTTSVLDVVGGSFDQSAGTLVDDVVNQIAPDAKLSYFIPGASVGYVPATGEALDYQSADPWGSTSTQRLMVMGAVQNGFGIVVIANGSLMAPVNSSSPLWDGHPSPANLDVAYLADEGDLVDSIQWPSS